MAHPHWLAGGAGWLAGRELSGLGLGGRRELWGLGLGGRPWCLVGTVTNPIPPPWAMRVSWCEACEVAKHVAHRLGSAGVGGGLVGSHPEVLHAGVGTFSGITMLGHTGLPGITPAVHEDDVVWRLMVAMYSLVVLNEGESLRAVAMGTPRVVKNALVQLAYVGETWGIFVHVQADILHTKVVFITITLLICVIGRDPKCALDFPGVERTKCCILDFPLLP